MFERVTIRVADLESSARFYSTVLSALGIERTPAVERTPEWGEFSLAAADDDHPDTQRLHIGFASPSRGRVDQFWHAGTEAGYRDTARPARGRSTAPSTTAASCSTPTATAPRPSTMRTPPIAR
jgi:catechol 2,3-dioxygenase-like lactoylglutathione lyase family enzyme